MGVTPQWRRVAEYILDQIEDEHWRVDEIIPQSQAQIAAACDVSLTTAKVACRQLTEIGVLAFAPGLGLSVERMPKPSDRPTGTAPRRPPTHSRLMELVNRQADQIGELSARVRALESAAAGHGWPLDS